MSIRYGNKNGWLRALLKGTLIITAAFVVLFYVLGLLFYIVLSDIKVIQIINLSSIGLIARVYLFCVTAVFAQIYLLMKYTKTSTFMIMGGVSIFLAMTNPYQWSIFRILHQSSNLMITLLNVFVSLAIAISLIVLIQRRISKKELTAHEN